MKNNIIFYFSDQQRYDTFNETVMPNLTEFSEDATVFDNCYTCQPVCGPARACLQTGVYPSVSGCYINGIPLPDDGEKLAEIFNKNGYDTAYIGKLHLASGKNGGKRISCETKPIPKERLWGYSYFRGADVLEFTSHGYDGYVFDENGNKIDFKGYRADRINDFALEYIENHNEDKPFFMFVSQLEPHHQNDRRRFEGPTEKVETDQNYPIPADLTFLKGDYEKMYPDYLAAIESLDENFGKLVALLKKKGIYDNTDIIYTSDHGCHFKTRNSEYKRSCHDASIHIPLVIKGEGFTKNSRSSKLVSLADLPPTLLNLAGIPIPTHFQGHSLLGDEKRDCVFLQISESQCGRAIRTDRYTYSVSRKKPLSKSSKVYFDDFLYDNLNDPCQRNNLIKSPDYREVKTELRELLISEIEKIEGKRPLILPKLL